MKGLTLCDKIDSAVGITTQSWRDGVVFPEDFICKYTNPDLEGVQCSKDYAVCPIYELIKEKMKK